MTASNVIKMPPRFDYTASPAFNASLTAALSASDAMDHKVIIDCEKMDYLDSAGIGILVMSHKKAQNSNAKLTMINVKQSAKEILLLANLQKLIDIH